MSSKLRFNLLFSTLLTVLFTLTAQHVSYAQEGDAAVAAAPEAKSEAVTQGEALFKKNCTTCHQVHKKVIGPALANLSERRDLEWVTRFVWNSQKVIASGDEYAVALYEEYNKTQMTAFPSLTEEEISSMYEYINWATVYDLPQAEVASGGGDGAEGVQGGASVNAEYLNAIMVGLVIVLVFILIVLLLIVNVLTRYLRETKELDQEDEEVVGQRIDIFKLARSNAFIFLATFFFVVIVVKTLVDGLFSVGVQQGYAPKQPIAFSHELHAGQYEIDCQYCHTGVRISKSANIPSANICMNCHSRIKTESPEIQKIYRAVENNKPIEWVRIHNLPDLAYFNHAQHVAVGGIECETCHGPIEEMEVVYQYSKLTMGWCISCHRETQINSKGNAYYDKLVEMHEESNGKDPYTVENNGGLECAKCHY